VVQKNASEKSHQTMIELHCKILSHPQKRNNIQKTNDTRKTPLFKKSQSVQEIMQSHTQGPEHTNTHRHM
jgi:hypothetical protein